MSYKIHYENHLRYKYPVKKFRKGNGKRLKRVITVLVLIATIGSPVRGWILEWILPANREIVAEAFSQMVCDVREGGCVEDAVVTFYREVLANGKQ